MWLAGTAMRYSCHMTVGRHVCHILPLIGCTVTGVRYTLFVCNLCAEKGTIGSAVLALLTDLCAQAAQHSYNKHADHAMKDIQYVPKGQMYALRVCVMQLTSNTVVDVRLRPDVKMGFYTAHYGITCGKLASIEISPIVLVTPMT